MVQLEPNLTLTLKHLATCGAVLSTEQQVQWGAAFDPMLILATLVLVGKSCQQLGLLRWMMAPGRLRGKCLSNCRPPWTTRCP